MRGVLNVLVSVAAGVAIGLLVPLLPLPFDNDPPLEEEPQSVPNASADRRDEDEAATVATTTLPSLSSLVEMYQVNTSMSDAALDAMVERMDRDVSGAGMPPNSTAAASGYPAIDAPRTELREVPILRHEDIFALLDDIAPPPSSKTFDGVTCTLCLDSILLGERVRLTTCNHTFHASCLEKWILHITDRMASFSSYTQARDGSLQFQFRFPFCPNCSKLLDVMPRRSWTVVLVAVLTMTCPDDRFPPSFEQDVVVRDKSDPPVALCVKFDEFSLRPHWMCDNDTYQYSFVPENESLRMVLRVADPRTGSPNTNVLEQQP